MLMRLLRTQMLLGRCYGRFKCRLVREATMGHGTANLNQVPFNSQQEVAVWALYACPSPLFEIIGNTSMLLLLFPAHTTHSI